MAATLNINFIIMFYQRSLRVVNSDTDPPDPPGPISGGGVRTGPMDAPMDDTAYSDHCLALRDVSGFRKLFQNRNITATRILNGSD